MIIWSGYGFLVVVITFGCSLALNFAFNARFGAGYYEAHKWPLAISLLMSAAICWVLGMALGNRASRRVIDKATGKEMVLRGRNHSLFFIPVQFWGPILAVIGAVLFMQDPTNPLKANSFSSVSGARTALPTPAATTDHASNSASVEAAQKAAVQKYPELAAAGSKLNSAFVARYKLYQQTNPQYFNDPAWPMKLADEAAGMVK